MKVLSLEEIDHTDFDVAEDFARLLHTAREYHRLKKALEFYAANTKFDRADMQWKNDNGAKAREALRESEGEK